MAMIHCQKCRTENKCPKKLSPEHTEVTLNSEESNEKKNDPNYSNTSNHISNTGRKSHGFQQFVTGIASQGRHAPLVARPQQRP